MFRRLSERASQRLRGAIQQAGTVSSPETQSHSSQTVEQSRSGGNKWGQHIPVIVRQVAVVRQGWGQARKSSWRIRIFIREVHGKAQERLQQLRKGQRRSVRTLKSSRVVLGSPNEISDSFFTKLSPQQPDPRPHHCTMSELVLSTGCQSHRSRSGLLALTYVVVKFCVMFSYISFLCTELEDDSDTSAPNTVIKLDKFS